MNQEIIHNNIKMTYVQTHKLYAQSIIIIIIIIININKLDIIKNLKKK